MLLRGLRPVKRQALKQLKGWLVIKQRLRLAGLRQQSAGIVHIKGCSKGIAIGLHIAIKGYKAAKAYKGDIYIFNNIRRYKGPMPRRT